MTTQEQQYLRDTERALLDTERQLAATVDDLTDAQAEIQRLTTLLRDASAEVVHAKAAQAWAERDLGVVRGTPSTCAAQRDELTDVQRRLAAERAAHDRTHTRRMELEARCGAARDRIQDLGHRR